MKAALALLLGLLAGAGARARPDDSLQFAIVLRGGWYQAIDRTGRVLADSLCPATEPYPAYAPAAEGLFPYVRNGRVGFRDHHNAVVVPPVYVLAAAAARSRYPRAGEPPTRTVFFRGRAVVGTAGGRFGLIDRRGRLVADTVYDFIAAPDPGSGAYAARRGGRLFVLDREGRNLLDAAACCDTALVLMPAFSEGRLCVLLRPDPAAAATAAPGPLHGFLHPGEAPDAAAQHSWRAGFVDGRGAWVIPPAFEIGPGMLGNRNADHRHQMTHGKMCGFGRSQAALLWKPYPDPYYLGKDYYRFEGGRCLAHRGGLDVVIDRQGDSVYTLPYHQEVTNHRGFLRYTTRTMLFGDYGTAVGIRDRAGRSILEEARQVQAGDGDLFLVTTGPGYGGFYIDGTGQRRFGGPYIEAGPFRNGLARISTTHRSDPALERRSGWIDTAGRFYPVARYRVEQFSGGLLIARDAAPGPGGVGMLRPDGTWRIPPVYGALRPYRCGLAAARPADAPPGTWGFIDERQALVLPAVYDGVATDFAATVVPGP